MKKPKILIIGSINMDLCLQTKRIPAAGESLLCDTCDSYRYIHGGKGANQAVAAARLEADVTFAGKVGSDPFGIELAASLKEEGINTGFLTVDNASATGLAVIILEATGQNRIMIYPGSNMRLTKNDIDNAFQYNYDAMIIQFEIPRDIIIYACETAKKRGIPFVVDAGPAQDFPIEKIPGSEIFTPNETETYALCGLCVEDEQSAKTAAEILMKRNDSKYIVIKAGENGAYLYDGGEILHFTSYKVKPVDTTAAGDAFTAAMTTEYIKTDDIVKAIEFAQAAGAVTVTKIGAQPSLPTIENINAFLAGVNNA